MAIFSEKSLAKQVSVMTLYFNPRNRTYLLPKCLWMKRTKSVTVEGPLRN